MPSSETAVVITCHNLGAMLSDAVESIFAQTARAAEIVIVDDGSRDLLTLQEVYRLDAHEPAVTVIRSENNGPAHARNLGVEATTAPNIVLLDGDDVFERSYLEKAEALLRERTDLSFVCCALQAFGGASYRWKPPPYTVADSIGRGACGHISTVFRREVWEAVGGFDDALPAYEDVDFWLRAMGEGFRGVILDEALVRYRVRDNSRYHGAIVRDDYVRAKEALVRKHAAAIRPRGEDVLVALLDFQREQTEHARSLAGERTAIAETLVPVDEQTEQIRAVLAERGIAEFDWGEFAEPVGLGPKLIDPIEQHYLDLAAKELGNGAGRRRTLTVRAGDPTPDEGTKYDVVVLAGALEFAPDPIAMLTGCRDALRPGGALVVSAAAMAFREKQLRGFTEASLRALMCELFDPADVVTTSYGNLITCLAQVAGRSPGELSAEELARRDPRFPTVVAAAIRPRPRRQRRSLLASRRLSAPPRRITPPGRARRTVVLCYHRVAALRPDTHALCVPPDMFAGHMRMIARRYRPVQLDDLVGLAIAGELPPGAVAVTFDDGYADNLEVASPILEELEIPATFFVSGALPESATEAWWDTLERIFLAGEPIPELLRLERSEFQLDLPTATPEEREAAIPALHARLIGADASQIAAITSDITAWSGLDLRARDTHRLMTAAEVVELSHRPGHQIGAHGLSHLCLPVHTPAIQKRELSRSKANLERLLESSITAVAYPYGECDVRTVDIAEEVGYAIGCTVESETVTIDSDPLRVPRFEVRNTHAEALEMRLERMTARV